MKTSGIWFDAHSVIASEQVASPLFTRINSPFYLNGTENEQQFAQYV